MALLVRVLLVLAILPILHPPGVCCCWIAPVAPRPEPVQVRPPAPVKKCRCCAARPASDLPRADLARNNQEHPPHRSDCPVVAGVDQTWHTETQAPILDLLLEQGTSSSGAAIPPILPTFATPRSWPSDPPTYLKQCVLRC